MNTDMFQMSLEDSAAGTQQKIMLCEMRINDLVDRDFFLTGELEKTRRQLIQATAFLNMSRDQKIGFLRRILEKLENGDSFWWERATDWK